MSSSAIRCLHVSKSLLEHDTKQSIINMYQLAKPFRTHPYSAFQIKALCMFTYFTYAWVVSYLPDDEPQCISMVYRMRKHADFTHI